MIALTRLDWSVGSRTVLYIASCSSALSRDAATPRLAAVCPAIWPPWRNSLCSGALRGGCRPPYFGLAHRLSDRPQRFASIYVVEQRRAVIERAKNLPAAVHARRLERFAP